MESIASHFAGYPEKLLATTRDCSRRKDRTMNPHHRDSGNQEPKGAAITYLGPQVARFVEVFETRSRVGRVMIPHNRVAVLGGAM